LSGRRVVGLGRRAKYLLFHFDDGAALISHLGMSGSWRIEIDDASQTPGDFHHDRSKASAHDHAVFHLRAADDRKARIVYNDPRRFGFMLMAEQGRLDEHPFLAGLGVDPAGNELDGSVLARLFDGKKAPLKAALLDQRLIAGLGNIYVCEALWRAGLSPKRLAGTVAGQGGRPTVKAERLATSVRDVIADALAAGGSSLRDYVHADGSLGYFQHSFSVYDREGEPCPREACTGVVHRITSPGARHSIVRCASDKESNADAQFGGRHGIRNHPGRNARQASALSRSTAPRR
jgi:formamidopyrimidine-DNA glycosylase